jgi:hypothetical protein
MIGFAAEGLMELEGAGLTGAVYGEKGLGRNGYRGATHSQAAEG